MIHIIELESLKERYTFWWHDYIPNRIKRQGIECQVITGETLTDTVETGTVLDASGTNYFKASQLQKICQLFHDKKIQPYDHFLVADIWFPGIEMIRYMSELYNIPVKIWGVWHAGSSTMNDFAEPMHSWSKYFEVGFLNMCDGVFVGSDYSKESIVNRLLYAMMPEEKERIASKIYGYGMPIDFHALQKYSVAKENIILFPHRPDTEKNPNIFIDIIYGLSTFWDDFENYKFIFCTSKKEYKSKSIWINALIASLILSNKNIEVKEDLSKEEYYTFLGKSKLMISTTSEENFGYCAVEALAMGTQPLLPNAFSHKEIVEDNYKILYDDYDDLMKKIIDYSKEPVGDLELKEYVKPYDTVVEKWLEIMGF